MVLACLVLHVQLFHSVSFASGITCIYRGSGGRLHDADGLEDPDMKDPAYKINAHLVADGNDPNFILYTDCTSL
jgi:hypothetical protein